MCCSGKVVITQKVIKMAINNTIEKHERIGLELLSKLHPDTCLDASIYGWHWTNDKNAHEVEQRLSMAGTPAAWMGLGRLYEQAANTSRRLGTAFCFTATNLEVLSYWAIKAYLHAGDEAKAIELLQESKSLKCVIYTLLTHARGKTYRGTGDPPPCRNCDLPDFSTINHFLQELEKIGREDPYKV